MSICVGRILCEQYLVVHRLCTRKSSTIWLIKDQKSTRYLALKAASERSHEGPPCRCPTATATLPRETDAIVHPGQYSVLHIVDSFLIGDEDGSQFTCTIYPLLGPDISALALPNSSALPWELLRRVTMHLLLALEYLHTIKRIVHTDIHHQNILLHPIIEQVPSAVERFLADVHDPSGVDCTIPFSLPVDNEIHITLIDYDLAHSTTNADKHAFLIQPDHLRAPEVTIGSHWGLPADIWNLGCLIFEMATSRHLFPADVEGRDPTVQLGRIASVLGDFPLEFLKSGQYWTRYFTEKGQVKRNADTGFPLTALIYFFLKEDPDRPDHSDLRDEDLADFMDFLTQMIRIQPEDRLTASQLLKHEWMQPALRQYVSELTNKSEPNASEQETSK